MVIHAGSSYGSLFRPLASAGSPPAPGSGTPPDQVALSREARRKKFRALAWAGFGVQVAGAAMVLTTGSWLGVGIFAVGSAMIVGGEAMARRA
ncbi:MAG: hypothetical protein AB1758_25205 [Candidatus Eremiobacterota bacterium]